MNAKWSFRRLIAVALLFPAIGNVAVVSAQDPIPGSLAIVPSDVSFYFATMNHAKCWQAVVESRAYQRLCASPVGEKMRKAYRRGRSEGFEQFGESNPFAQYLEGYAEVFGNPGTKFAWPFLREMFSNEIFIYGDAKLPPLIEAINQFRYDMVRLSSVAEDERSSAILKSMKDRLGDAPIPTLVLGTVLSDPSNMTDLMRLARSGLEAQLDRLPVEARRLADGFRVLEEGDMLVLSMTLDIESIPWDQFALDEQDAALVQALRETFGDKSISIGVGVKGRYLIATVAPSLDHVKTLGQGNKLIDASRLEPLRTAFTGGKTLTSAHYFSADYMRLSTDFNGIVEMLPSIAEQALIPSGNVDATRDIVESLRKDASELVADLARITPPAGESFGFSFLNGGGIEGYAYHFSKSPFEDSSKPLAMFRHAGERPAVVVASRGKGSLEQFQMVRKWAGVALEYAEKIIPLVGDESDEADQALQILVEIKPFLQRLGDTTETKVVPATEGGEAGLIVDFVESQYQWHPDQPPATHPLAIPSLSLVLQISDEEKIRAAGRDYFALAQDVLTWLRDQPGVEIPDDFRLTPPVVDRVQDREIYSYPLPAELEIDESILPHARLGKGWLVFSYFPDRSDAIVNESRPDWRVPLDPEHPATLGIYLNSCEFVDALDGWLRFAIEVEEARGQTLELRYFGSNDLLDFGKPELMESWDRVIDFAKCFRGFSTLRFVEGEATISHFHFAFEDVK